MRITYEEIIISANINGNRKYIYSQKTKSIRNSIASRILESEKKRLRKWQVEDLGYTNTFN